MKLSVCAETVFTDRDIAGRAEGIGRHGIKDFELWDLRWHDPLTLERTIHEDGYRLLSYAGNRDCTLINPDDRAGFLAELDTNLQRAQALKASALIVLTDAVDDKGIPIPPDRPLTHDEKLASVQEGLSQAVPRAEEAGITLLVEPLNTKVDHPGYFLPDSATGLELVRAVNSPRVKLLYDIYHQQLSEGDLIRTIEANLPWIGHIHAADVPGRHEPGTGEINHANIARMLVANSYDGFVGLECFPAGDSDEALRAFISTYGEN